MSDNVPYDPFATPESDINTGAGAAAPSAEGEFQQATRGERLAAVGIDGLYSLGALLAGFVVAAPLLFLNGGSVEKPESWLWGLVAAVFTLGALGIYQLYLVITTGQSLGKKAMRIVIVRRDGVAIDWVTILVKRRLALGVLMLIPVIGSLVVFADYLMIFREDNLCLHDHIAGTRVVRQKSSPSSPF